MKNTKRKGFTIVELVIVIAVIAILAAVLIPTFSNLVEKASISADTQLSKNMNTALSIAEAADGKNVTFYDAIADIQAAGYTVEKLTPTSEGCHLTWDQKNDRIVFLDSDKKEIYADKSDYAASDLWFVAKTVAEAESAEFNVYLAGTDFAGDITVSRGIDVGENTGISKITYSNPGAAQSVIIRTNGGKLIVDAPKDTVHHYNEAQRIDIISVDIENSFHEFGTAGYIELVKGHFIAEETAKVFALVSTGAPSEVKVDKKASATIEQAINTNGAPGEHSGNVELTPRTDMHKDELERLIYDAESKVLNTLSCNGKYYKSMADIFNNVAKINGEGYSIGDDVIITLYKDITEDGIIVEPGKNITIDFNGHTYDVEGTVGSAGTTTLSVQFKENSIVTLKNGTLSSSTAKMLIQNYSNLTLDNMTIDGTKLIGNAPYVVSNNNGNITINDTTILAKESGCAFDVCRFSTYESVNVNVTGSSKIDGKIEMTANSLDPKDGITLTLDSGDFTTARLDISDITSIISNGKVSITKSNDVTINVTEGYSWNANGKLVKND